MSPPEYPPGGRQQAGLLVERAAAWRSLRHALIESKPTPTGAVLRYRLEPGMAEALLELLEAERQCCPSLSLEATVHLRLGHEPNLLLMAPELLDAHQHFYFSGRGGT